MADSNAQPLIYLDHHATTPVLPSVLEAMTPYFCDHFGNAHSTHQWGWKGERAYNLSSQQVAKLLECKPSQVYFTSGATESLHWCLVGWSRMNKGGKILTTATEHKATYGACDFAQELGAKVQTLSVDSYGRVKIVDLIAELEKDTTPTLLTFIYGNNEIGTLNPIKEICDLKNRFPHLKIHADAAQCAGKVNLSFQELGLDYLSLSGHKLYAPKGVGALIMAEPNCIKPLFCGGGQQRGQRAGTLDVPSIVGLGAACQWAIDNMNQEKVRLLEMRNFIMDQLVDGQSVQLNGHPTERLPHNVSLTFQEITMDKLLLKLPKVGFSGSSACSSGMATVSHVLKAIGRSDQQAQQTIRIGLGHNNKFADIQYVVGQIKKILLDIKNFPSSSK